MTPEAQLALAETLEEVTKVLEAMNMRLFHLEREVFKIKTNGHDE